MIEDFKLYCTLYSLVFFITDETTGLILEYAHFPYLLFWRLKAQYVMLKYYLGSTIFLFNNNKTKQKNSKVRF